MGVCSNEVQVVNIPLWAMQCKRHKCEQRPFFLEKWHGCATFADPIVVYTHHRVCGIGKKGSQGKQASRISAVSLSMVEQ